MLQVRDDNAAAFEELVFRYQDRLLSVLRHMLGDRDQAEDLAQEVFLRVYRARKDYAPGAKFATWLFTIANNVARNAKRTLSRRKEVHVQGTESGTEQTGANLKLDDMAVEASGLMPTRQLDKSEASDVVRLAISNLSDRQRMALLLCKFENMSYVEIADTMGLTSKAVKSLLARARVNLRDALVPYMEDGGLPAGEQVTGEQDTGVG
ncbi:MAG: sigma-70 family RNA polymerase sigma factor [Pirellulaceae bacterium]